MPKNSQIQLVALWLHGKSGETQRSYEGDLRCFISFLVGRKQVQLNDLDLREVTLNDVQGFDDFLEGQGLAAASRRRKLAALRSLLRFAHELGYLNFNVGLKLKLPQPKQVTAQRILSELQVMTMMALAAPGRELEDWLSRTYGDNKNLYFVGWVRRSDDFENKAINFEERRNPPTKVLYLAIQSTPRSRESRVSYLYKYPELKQYIAELRNKQSHLPPPAKPVSSKSHDRVVARFKERIQKLEEQNRELRRKNEALAGQVYRVHTLQEQVERQQQTIEDLQARLEEASEPKAVKSKILVVGWQKLLKKVGPKSKR